MKSVLIPTLLILIFSCSSTHKIVIESDNKATISFAVTNKPSLATTLNEWSAVQGEETLIDEGEIAKELQKDRNIFGVTVNNPSKDIFTGNFRVMDIDNLFSSIFNLSDIDGKKVLTISLSMDNYRDLKTSLKFLQEESIEMLGPEGNQGVSQEEYLEMMSFSLGDEGASDILSSEIELDITVNGDIIETSGARTVDSNRALINIPLLDIILLNRKLVYTITYME